MFWDNYIFKTYLSLVEGFEIPTHLIAELAI
jgi:hypothetical protein